MPLSWELNGHCTVANGGYGKLREISSLVWLARSTEFSILLLQYYGNFGGSAMLTPSCGELHKF
jgi:hypothetical protein